MTKASSGTPEGLTPDVFEVDAERVVNEIVTALRSTVGGVLRRRGAVVAVSGGIDSAVTAALCVRAFGADRTLAVLMPEADSAEDTLELSGLLAEALGIEAVVEDITPILSATGCYVRRDEAVRAVVPQFGPGWKFKLVLPSVLATDSYRLFSVVAESPEGEQNRGPAPRLRVPHGRRCHELQAANAEDDRVLPRRPAELRRRRNAEPARVRPGLLREAGRRSGRRQADRAPLQDAGLPAGGPPRRARAHPLAAADDGHLPARADAGGVLLLARLRPRWTSASTRTTTGSRPKRSRGAVGLSPDDVQRVYDDIDQKRRTTRYLHLPPQLVASVPEVPVAP